MSEEIIKALAGATTTAISIIAEKIKDKETKKELDAFLNKITNIVANATKTIESLATYRYRILELEQTMKYHEKRRDEAERSSEKRVRQADADNADRDMKSHKNAVEVFEKKLKDYIQLLTLLFK